MTNSAHISYWEREHWLTYDLVIVGAGITGFSVAAEYLEKFPSKKVAVFERGVLPTGASTKNAGFACFGSPTEILSDIESIGEAAAFQLIKKRYSGLQLLFKRFSPEASGVENLGGYELLSKSTCLTQHQLDYLNNLLEPITGQKTFQFENNKIKDFGFNDSFVEQLIFNPLEAQIDSGLLLKSMYQYIISKGAVVFTGAEVKQIDHEASSVKVLADSLGKQIEFTAKQVVICTNAFAQQFIPAVDITPGRGQILVTEPIAALSFKGTFHFDEGYYYFRNVGNRILLGGGRNLDFSGETTTEIELSTTIQDALVNLLQTVIFPKADLKIEQRWAGIMAFGQEKSPIVSRVSENVFCAVRGGGMGVALASNTAIEAVDLLTES